MGQNLIDSELKQFEALTQELKRLSVQTDKGLERAMKCIEEINECRIRMEGWNRIHVFVERLDPPTIH